MQIKNIYDDSTLDTLRALDENIRALMHHNPDFAHVEIHQYERMPIKAGSPKSHIKVDVSRQNVKGVFYLSEELVTRLEESNEIRQELTNILKQIKVALQR
jgi:hypothetical protein